MGSYKCGWGCTSYNPSCDACEAQVNVEDEPYFRDEVWEKRHKAACLGMTEEEYDEYYETEIQD